MPESVCEVPGCGRPVTEHRRQRSGDVLRVCGQPHIAYGQPPPDAHVEAALSASKGAPDA